MVKYLEIHKCTDCPHCDNDPQTYNHKLWGKYVCVHDWDGTQEEEPKIKLLEGDMFAIPEWCPLDGPNDL